MNRICILIFLSFPFCQKTAAQVSVESFFNVMKRFVEVNYESSNVRKIKRWSNETRRFVDKEKVGKHRFFKGVMKMKEGVTIEFDILLSALKVTSEERCGGEIYISGDWESRNFYTYTKGFDSVYTKYDSADSKFKLVLKFYKYSNPTNRVLQNIDTSLTQLFKDEYYDFYFADLNKATSTWQIQFKNFMQPYSESFIHLINRNNVKGIFDIISLKNKGFSWFMSEGLWYYNQLHPILTEEQLSIINAYNGKDGMVSFRPIKDLEKVYKF